MAVTLVLLGILGSIFLKGFKDAIGVAVVLVALYLALNAGVVTVAIQQVLLHQELPANWIHDLLGQHDSPLAMIGISLVLFPKLALA